MPAGRIQDFNAIPGDRCVLKQNSGPPSFARDCRVAYSALFSVELAG
jgi:hypothetical protein